MSRTALIFLMNVKWKNGREHIELEQVCNQISDYNIIEQLENNCDWEVTNEDAFIGEMDGATIKEIIDPKEFDLEVLNDDFFRIEIM